MLPKPFRASSLCIFLFSLFGTAAYGQNLQWVKEIGNTGWDQVSDIAIDGNNNIFLFGEFKGTVDFDPGAGVYNLSSIGEEDAFICKLNDEGNLLWVKQYGDSAFVDKNGSLALDHSGNVYVTGSFLGAVDFDPGTGSFNLTSNGPDRDIFIQKLGSNGEFIWAKQISGQPSGAPTPTHSNDIAIDDSGNLYFTGYFDGTVDFNPDPSATFNLTVAAYSDIFICKLDMHGNFIWAKKFSGTQGGVGYSLDLDENNNVYSTGTIGPTATVDFDPGPETFNLTASDSIQAEIYVSKLDSAGNFVWAKLMGVGQGSAIAVDQNGSSYSSGWFPLGSTPVLNKLDSSGNIIWSKQLGGLNGQSIALDNNDHVYTTGSCFGTNDFDPGPGTFNITGGNSDSYMSKFDSSGEFVWAGIITGTSQVWASSIAIDLNDNIYLTGYYDGTADLRSDTTVNLNLSTPITSYNAFVLKLQSNDVVGVSEKDFAKNIRIYPNPTKGSLNIEFRAGHDAQKIVLRTITGRLVFEKLVNKIERMDIRMDVPDGIYILEVSNSIQQKAVFKVIKY